MRTILFLFFLLQIQFSRAIKCSDVFNRENSIENSIVHEWVENLDTYGRSDWSIERTSSTTTFLTILNFQKPEFKLGITSAPWKIKLFDQKIIQIIARVYTQKGNIIFELSSRNGTASEARTIRQLIRSGATRDYKSGVSIQRASKDQYGVPSPEIYKLLKELNIGSPLIAKAPKVTQQKTTYTFKTPETESHEQQIFQFIFRTLYNQDHS